MQPLQLVDRVIPKGHISKTLSTEGLIHISDINLFVNSQQPFYVSILLSQIM